MITTEEMEKRVNETKIHCLRHGMQNRTNYGECVACLEEYQ